MLRYSVVIFALLLFSGASGWWFRRKPARPKRPVNSVSKFIKLALSVSKATYLPFPTKRFIKQGYIQETGNRRACSIGNWVAKGFKKRDTEVLVFKNHQQRLAVFGFRGTTTFNDWLKNFNIFLVRVRINRNRFRIHKGFRNRYFDIASWFKVEYQSIPRSYKIIITGHSLGGAMATVASTFASGFYHRRPDAVITFASPRVGNNDFRNYYDRTVGCKNTLRITAKFDAIPFTPGRILGYRDTCDAHKVSSGVYPFNPIKNHGLYTGYERGLKRKYGNFMNSVNTGCDRTYRGR